MRGVSKCARALVATVGLAVASVIPHPHSYEVLAEQARKTQTARDFFTTQYERHRAGIERRFSPAYQDAVAQGMQDTPATKRRFMVALFLHEFVKRNGISGMVWMAFANEDPHTAVSLTRTAFAPTPQHLAARCDRIEMWYKALARFFDVPARIVLLEPDHTATEVQLGNRYLLFNNAIPWYALRSHSTPDQPPADGKYDIQRPNRRAVLPDAFELNENGARRVAETIARYFGECTAPAVCE